MSINNAETHTFNFTGCKHLDFDRARYAPTCDRNAISTNGQQHVFWFRKRETTSAMVQFCKKRGRLNHQSSCIGKCNARCSDYADHNHSIVVPLAELES